MAPHRRREARDTSERDWTRIQEEQEREVAPSEMLEEAPSGLVFHGEGGAEDRPEGQTPLPEAAAGPSTKGGRGPRKSPPRHRRRPHAGSLRSVKRLAKERTSLPKAFVEEVQRVNKSEGRDFTRNARGTCRLYAAGR